MDRRKSHIAKWSINNRLPMINLSQNALIEITGNSRVLIENHKGVVAYTKEMIRINSANGVIRIVGTGLLLECMSRFQLVITGCIYEVTLESGVRTDVGDR